MATAHALLACERKLYLYYYGVCDDRKDPGIPSIICPPTNISMSTLERGRRHKVFLGYS